MFTLLSAPISVQWELTSWCPYNCLHCYNYWKRDSTPPKKITGIKLQTHRKTCVEIIQNQVPDVTLTGGEPLGVIKQLYPEIKMLREKGIRLTVNTTLSMFNKEIGKTLGDLGIHSMLVSLISCNEKINDQIAQTKGAFKRTLKGIELAKSLGFSFGINMVVTRKNFATIYETGRLAYEIGARGFSATKAATPSNCTDFTKYSISQSQLSNMFLELLRVRSDFGITVDSLEHYPACAFPNEEARNTFGSRNCSAGKTGCAIGFDGGIRPCSHCPTSYGNINKEGLVKSWENMEEWRTGELIPTYCMDTCGEVPNKCGGGCRIEALTYNKKLSEIDPYCNKEKPPAKKRKEFNEPISKGNVFEIDKNTMFREEPFGYIAYSKSKSKWTPIEPRLHNFLTGSEAITAPNLAENYNTDLERAIKTLQILSEHTIIVPMI